MKVKFPDDYGNTELAGKDAVFKCTVKEIREFVDQPIDDELAKKNNFENLEAMKKAVSDRIGQEYTQISRGMIKRSCSTSSPTRTSSRCRKAWSRASSTRSGSASRKPRRTARRSKTRRRPRAEYREIAERRVRLGLLLADVGRSNNIDVTPEELNQAIMREAMRYPGQERQVLEFYSKNDQLKEQMRAPIFEEKTVDFILELAKVTDKSVTPEELLEAARKAESDEETARRAVAVCELIRSGGLEWGRRHCHFSTAKVTRGLRDGARPRSAGSLQ